MEFYWYFYIDILIEARLERTQRRKWWPVGLARVESAITQCFLTSRQLGRLALELFLSSLQLGLCHLLGGRLRVRRWLAVDDRFVRFQHGWLTWLGHLWWVRGPTHLR